MSDEVRPLPAELPTTLRDSVMERLKNLEGHALSLSFDYEVDGVKSKTAKVIFMVKEPTGWSFAAWAKHEVVSNNTGAGWELKKVWGQ